MTLLGLSEKLASTADRGSGSANNVYYAQAASASSNGTVTIKSDGVVASNAEYKDITVVLSPSAFRDGSTKLEYKVAGNNIHIFLDARELSRSDFSVNGDVVTIYELQTAQPVELRYLSHTSFSFYSHDLIGRQIRLPFVPSDDISVYRISDIDGRVVMPNTDYTINSDVLTMLSEPISDSYILDISYQVQNSVSSTPSDGYVQLPYVPSDYTVTDISGNPVSYVDTGNGRLHFETSDPVIITWMDQQDLSITSDELANKTFELPYLPVPGSVTINKNGSSFSDYTITDKTITITETLADDYLYTITCVASYTDLLDSSYFASGSYSLAAYPDEDSLTAFVDGSSVEAIVVDNVVTISSLAIGISEITISYTAVIPSQYINVPTSPYVKDGDAVLVQTVDGVPLVIGVKGQGDKIDARVGMIEADYVKATRLDAEVANLGYLASDSATITDLQAQTAKIENLSASEISAATAYIGELEAGSLSAHDLLLDTAKIDDLDVESLDAAAAYIGSLEADNISANDIYAANQIVTNLQSTYAQINAANINTATIRDGWFDQIMVQTGMIVEQSDIFYLNAIKVNASSITAGTIDVERLIVTQTDQQGHQQKYLVHIDPSTSQPTYEKLDGNVIEDLTITTGKIVAGAITAEKITTDNISGPGGWINLRNGTFEYVSAVTGDGISWDGSHLTISAESLNLLMQESSQPNLSPYFAYELSNVYDATTNPGGYWRSINSSYLTSLENGWVHVERANSGSSTVYVWCAPSAVWQQAHAKLIENGTYTVVAECRNCESIGSPYLITASRTTSTVPGMLLPPSGADIQLLLDGTMSSLCVKTVAVADFSNAESATRTLISIPAGATVKCDIRISLFAGEYSGYYKPFVDQTLAVRMSDAETSIEANSEAIALRATKTEVYETVNPNLSPFFA